MKNKSKKENMPDDSSGYSFSNFYCHPSFLSDVNSEMMKQIFGSSGLNVVQTNKSGKKSSQSPGLGNDKH